MEEKVRMEKSGTRKHTLIRRLGSAVDSSPFLKYAENVYSQCGEDGILKEIFRRLPCRSSRSCVDIGAWDGEHLSNTRNLFQSKDTVWRGLLIEADEERATQCRQLYQSQGKSHVDVWCGLVGLEGVTSLTHLLQQYNVDVDFDFLNIDVDGADYHLWRNCCVEGKYHPLVVCIEFNPTIPNDIVIIQEANTHVHKGNSLLALVELGKELGYKLVVTTTWNAIFVSEELFSTLLQDDVKQYDNSIHLLHTTSMITEIFQTYEGELLLAGPKKLLWHNVPINPQSIQVLPKKERVFPFAPQSKLVDNQTGLDNAESKRCSEQINNVSKRKAKTKDLNNQHNFVKRFKKYIRQIVASPISVLCIGVFLGFTLSHAASKLCRYWDRKYITTRNPMQM